MKRGLLIVVAAVFALIAVITVGVRQTSEPPPASAADTVGALGAEERDRISRFWELHREATNHRIADRIDEAADAYRAALELDPAHENSLYYLGSMYYRQGRHTDAESTWRRLAEVAPDGSRAFLQLGMLHSCPEVPELFDPESAEAEFKRALEINKEESGPVLRLGELALARGREAEARSYLDAVLGSNFRSIEALFLKGYLAWKDGAEDEALALFESAVGFARPSEPTEGVPGEGDTKMGAMPMLAKGARCATLGEFTDEMNLPEGAPLQDTMVRMYQRLDARLGEIRARL